MLWKSYQVGRHKLFQGHINHGILFKDAIRMWALHILIALQLGMLLNCEVMAVSTSPMDEHNLDTRVETLEIKQELATTASKLLHEDMLLIQTTLKNNRHDEMERHEALSDKLSSLSESHRLDESRVTLSTIESLLNDIIQRQEYLQTQIESVSNNTNSNHNDTHASLSSILQQIRYIQTRTPPTTPPTGKNCSYPLYDNGELVTCYRLPGSLGVPYSRAKQLCENIGGRIPRIDTEAKYKNFMSLPSLYGVYYWIEGTSVGTLSTAHYDDGTPYTFSKFRGSPLCQRLSSCGVCLGTYDPFMYHRDKQQYLYRAVCEMYP